MTILKGTIPSRLHVRGSRTRRARARQPPRFPWARRVFTPRRTRGVGGIHAEQTDAQGGCSGDAQSRGGAIRRTRERAYRSLRAMRPPPPVPPARVHVPRAFDVAPSARVSRRLRRAPDPLLRTDPRPTLAFPHRGRVARRGDTGGGGGRLGHGTGTRAPQVVYSSAQPRKRTPDLPLVPTFTRLEKMPPRLTQPRYLPDTQGQGRGASLRG